ANWISVPLPGLTLVKVHLNSEGGFPTLALVKFTGSELYRNVPLALNGAVGLLKYSMFGTTGTVDAPFSTTRSSMYPVRGFDVASANCMPTRNGVVAVAAL